MRTRSNGAAFLFDEKNVVPRLISTRLTKSWNLVQCSTKCSTKLNYRFRIIVSHNSFARYFSPETNFTVFKIFRKQSLIPPSSLGRLVPYVNLLLRRGVLKI